MKLQASAGYPSFHLGTRLITSPDQGRRVGRGRKERHACGVIGTRQYREMESNCANAPPTREPENIEAGGKAREWETKTSEPVTALEARKGRETNAPCLREMAMSMGAWETNMPERETAAVRRDGEPLTSAVQEHQQEEAAAERHQAAAREHPIPPAMKGTEPVTSPVTDPKTGSHVAVDRDGHQLKAAKVRCECLGT